MKNMIFLTGVAGEPIWHHAARDLNFYYFDLETCVNEYTYRVACTCTEKHLGLISESHMSGNTVDIFGSVRCTSVNGEKRMFVFVRDAKASLPFSEDRNEAVGEAIMEEDPRVFADKTVMNLVLTANIEKTTFIKAVAFGNIAKRIAMIPAGEQFSYKGYMNYVTLLKNDEEFQLCQLVITDFTWKGEMYERPQSYDAELYGSFRRERDFVGEHNTYQRNEQNREDYGNQRNYGYPHRQNGGRYVNRQRSSYRQPWERYERF